MNPLDQLKDIHLPSEVSWWPLAIGWWIAAALALLLIIFFLVLFKKHQHKKRRINLAMDPFEQLSNDQSLSSQEWLNELSILIRRIAINAHGRDKIAGLVGHDWLSYLDRSGDTREFSEGVGKVLAQQPYQPQVDYDREAITKLSRSWLKTQYQRGRHA